MESISYHDVIINKIADIPYGCPFRSDSMAEAVAEERGIPVDKAKSVTNVTLKRLADKGAIERFQKGIYYRARQTEFGKACPSEDILETQLLIHRGNEIIGYETGVYLMNKIGLTTLVTKKREIATNAYRKNIHARYIRIKKPVATVNTENFRYLQFLDMIRDLPTAPVDATDPKVLLHTFVKKNGLDTVQILTYARQYYPKKTLLRVIDILSET